MSAPQDGPRVPKIVDSPRRACTAGALALWRSAPDDTPSAESAPQVLPPPPRRQLRRQLRRQGSYGFSLMPISCLAVAFSMRSRLPPIMVPCIACIAASASSALEKETKPKPLLTPVSRSSVIVARSSVPYFSKARSRSCESKLSYLG